MEVTDPSEGAETSKNTSAYPRAVLALGRGKNLDAHVLDCQPLDLV